MATVREQIASLSVGQAYAELPFGSGYKDFGCSVNEISVEDLFAAYESCGFLYPAKRQRLAPYLPIIMENWRRTMSARDGFLHNVVVYGTTGSDVWASTTVWATGNFAVHSQHLVSLGRPEASRAVMLSTQSEMDRCGQLSAQNWFRAENRFPARVFGTCTRALGHDRAAVQQHSCLMIRRDCLPTASRAVRVERCSDLDAASIECLARRLTGPVQAQADEWLASDVELTQLDERYKQVGLRRYRRVFLATCPGFSEPVGFSVAYRGPLGLNFSFLENRCELWIEPRLDTERQHHAIASLVRAAADVYCDFELPMLVVTTSQGTGAALALIGACPMQEYSRSIWMRAGFAGWYEHVNGFYSRVIRASRRGASAAWEGAQL